MGDIGMSNNKDRKLWKSEDVIFHAPKTPISDDNLKEAEEFFDKFKKEKP